jgi:hypothetical protein
MNHRFKIGDRVRVVGILAGFYPGKIGTVVTVSPHETGVTELDHYVIEIPNVEMGDTVFCDFQLAPISTEDILQPPFFSRPYRYCEAGMAPQEDRFLRKCSAERSCPATARRFR